MKFVEEFRDPDLAKKLLGKIHRRSTMQVKLMEFCGGHTAAIFKYGLRQLLPPNIQMLSGPGCPVCVTAGADLDRAIALALIPGVIITSFGDMIRVPGSYSSLRQARAEGGDVRIVYSAQDALGIARDNPDRPVIFIAIGFETTAPTVAATILQAQRERINNFYVLSLHKLCPPIMKTLLDLGEVSLNGIICPGHVSAVIGSYPYRFIPDDYGISCVVSGFELLDILLCVDMLVDQIETGRHEVAIAYRRGVKPEGNLPAIEMMNSVFEVSEADWRGIGVVPSSGLILREKYRRFDAGANFEVNLDPVRETGECICGSILRGVSAPPDCKLFRKGCTPEHPLGPCMVSPEGSCAVYYRYGDIQ